MRNGDKVIKKNCQDQNSKTLTFSAQVLRQDHVCVQLLVWSIHERRVSDGMPVVTDIVLETW